MIIEDKQDLKVCSNEMSSVTDDAARDDLGTMGEWGTDENNNAKNENEPLEAVKENRPESSHKEQGDLSSPVKNEEKMKKSNGEDNEDIEITDAMLKKALENSRDKPDEKEQETVQNAPFSDLKIELQDGTVHIILVQNGNRKSNQNYSLKIKGVFNEDGFNSQNVVPSSTVEKDKEDKKTCEKCEEADKQSTEIVEVKDDDKIKNKTDLKKEENEEASVVIQEIQESINSEKELEKLNSPEYKQQVENDYKQVNEPRKESNDIVMQEQSDNTTNGTLEKEHPKIKGEGSSSLENQQPGVSVIDGEKDVATVFDSVNEPNHDLNNKVGEETINKVTNDSLNTEDSDNKQEKENVSPAYEQSEIQNGDEIINKASELSIIKTEMEKENAIHDEIFDDKESICNNASWNETDPIRFHSVHGVNVRVSSNGFLAQRHKLSSFFGKGIVFSSRPVGIGEKICIRFEETSNYWLGFMTFGFTNHDPETLAGDLPGIAVADLNNKPGFWAGHLAKSFCNKGNIFHYFVDASGSVHFGINGTDKGKLFWNVDTTKPIWALNDLFGYFTAISLVDPKTPIETRTSTFKENKQFGNLTSWITNSPNPCLKHQKGIILVPMNLHTTDGMNAQLLNFKGVATRTDDIKNHGYVFTERPMYLGQTIVIQILATGPGYEYLPIGLTCNDPATVDPSELPDDVEGLAEWNQNWLLIKNVANFVQYGDELAVTRTEDGDIRLRRNNGESITVAHFSKAQKFWTFIGIYGAIQMIRVWTTKRGCPCIRQTSKSALI